MTDTKGSFSLLVSKPQAVIAVSSIGYKPQKITLNGRTGLEDDSHRLDELIVVGYGTQRKSDLTGAVSRVSLVDSPIPNVSISQALAGASAGVNIQQTGMAGGNANLSVRGQTSLSANDNPFWC
ncbi:MAG: hypothetical protein QM669_06110 [Siphonobacter sp.]